MSATARQRVLRALQTAGPTGCTTATLCSPEVGGERFGARVMELRAEGHKIDSRRIREGSWLYAYVGHSGAAPAEQAAPLPSTPAQVLADLETRCFHCCDACAFTWRDGFWIEGCPACKAPAHWVASHYTADGARLHVPANPPEQAAA